jgi:hypothetical protein
MVSKQAAQNVDMKGLTLQKVNVVKGEEWYQVKMSKELAASENLVHDADISSAWEAARQNINISAEEESLWCYRLRQHSTVFRVRCIN